MKLFLLTFLLVMIAVVSVGVARRRRERIPTVSANLSGTGATQTYRFRESAKAGLPPHFRRTRAWQVAGVFRDQRLPSSPSHAEHRHWRLLVDGRRAEQNSVRGGACSATNAESFVVLPGGACSSIY
jgi:hypothetical protein